MTLLTKPIANGAKHAVISLNGEQITVDVDGQRFFANAEIKRTLPKGTTRAVPVLAGGEHPQMIILTEGEAKMIEAARLAAARHTPDFQARQLRTRIAEAQGKLDRLDYDRDGLTMHAINRLNAERDNAKAELAALKAAHPEVA